MKNKLPEAILKRGKMGFPVPVGKWFREGFRAVVDEYILSDRTLARGLFNPTYVRRLVAEHQAGANHAERLWALVNFEIWLRQFMDSSHAEESQISPAEAAVMAS